MTPLQNEVNTEDQTSSSSENNTGGQQSPAISRWLEERPWDEPFHSQCPRSEEVVEVGTSSDQSGDGGT
jgi:hypothetical protein